MKSSYSIGGVGEFEKKIFTHNPMLSHDTPFRQTTLIEKKPLKNVYVSRIS
jgi:hypothetical protein